MVMMIMMMVPIHTKMFLRFESLLRSSLIEYDPWVDCVGGYRGWIPWVDIVQKRGKVYKNKALLILCTDTVSVY